jgi:hypothetical protein
MKTSGRSHGAIPGVRGHLQLVQPLPPSFPDLEAFAHEVGKWLKRIDVTPKQAREMCERLYQLDKAGCDASRFLTTLRVTENQRAAKKRRKTKKNT